MFLETYLLITSASSQAARRMYSYFFSDGVRAKERHLSNSAQAMQQAYERGEGTVNSSSSFHKLEFQALQIKDLLQETRKNLSRFYYYAFTMVSPGNNKDIQATLHYMYIKRDNITTNYFLSVMLNKPALQKDLN